MTTNESGSGQPTAELPPVNGPAAPQPQQPALSTPSQYAPTPTAHKAHGVEVAIALAFVGAAVVFVAFVAGWTAHGVATHLQVHRFAMQQSRFTDSPSNRMMQDGSPLGPGHGCNSAPGSDTRRGYDGQREYVLPEGHPDIGRPSDQSPYDSLQY